MVNDVEESEPKLNPVVAVVVNVFVAVVLVVCGATVPNDGNVEDVGKDVKEVDGAKLKEGTVATGATGVDRLSWTVEFDAGVPSENPVLLAGVVRELVGATKVDDGAENVVLPKLKPVPDALLGCALEAEAPIDEPKGV